MTAVDNLNRTTTISGVNRTYDILGNTLTIGSTKSMTWDSLNRMLSYTSGSTTTDYQYRADGMRVIKDNGTTLSRFYYDGQMPIETTEITSSATVVTRNGLGARGIDRIERVGTSTTVGYPIYDGHGNMIATLSKSGSSYSLGDQRSYDAWGVIRSGNTTGDPKGRYCANLGHLDDDESSLTYMRARYYEVGSGRFISEDPEMNGENFYAYCGNDSVNYVDESGKLHFREGWVGQFAKTGFVLSVLLVFQAWAFAAIKEPAAATACLTVAATSAALALSGTDATPEVKMVGSLFRLLTTNTVLMAIIGTIGAALGKSWGSGIAVAAVVSTTTYTMVIIGALLLLDQGDE